MSFSYTCIEKEMLKQIKSNEFIICLLKYKCFNFLGTYCKKICNRKKIHRRRSFNGTSPNSESSSRKYMMTDIDVRTLEALPLYYDHDSIIRFYNSHRRILFHSSVFKLILHKLEEIISDMDPTSQSKYKLTIFTISNIIMHAIIERALHCLIFQVCSLPAQ